MLQKNASDYDIPIFMSETGCNEPPPRTFDDQTAIFGPDMADTWSGSIVYEWIEETNNYGLISYGPSVDPTATGAGILNGYTRRGTPTAISPDFDVLSSHWATLSPSGVSIKDYSPTSNPPACPSFTSGMWEVSGNAPLPTIGAKGTGYTSGLASAGAGTSTSASSAASATRISSIALRKRDRLGFWNKLRDFHERYPFWWFVIWAVVAVAGIGVLA